MNSKIMIITGSHRTKSYSTALAHAVADKIRNRGLDVDFAEIAELGLPFHDPIDHAAPQLSKNSAVRDFASRALEATGFVWVTPIYQGSFTSGFKNALDNLNIKIVKDKKVALMCHGGGRFGGSALDQMRTVAVNLHADLVTRGVITNPNDFEIVDDVITLSNPEILERIDIILDAML